MKEGRERGKGGMVREMVIDERSRLVLVVLL